MSKVQVLSHVELDIDELLKGVARLDTDELEHFITQVLAIRADRYIPNLPQAEVTLLQKINEGVPLEARRRYDELHQKLLDKTLTSNEQLELIELSNQIEEADLFRKVVAAQM